MTSNSVQHTLTIDWDVDANGVNVNPRLTNSKFHLAGLEFSFSCSYTGKHAEFPYKMAVELCDAAIVHFDHHWTISIECTKFPGARVLNADNRRRNIYRFNNTLKNYESTWTLLDFDVHTFRQNFDTTRQQAANYGNEYCVELIDDNNSYVWVNKELLAADSTFFQEKLFLPANVESLKLDGVSKADFLDYVHCIHPPTLKLSLARIDRILNLSKRFQNEALVLRCESFLRDFTSDAPLKQREHLVEADRQRMSEVFKTALKRMKRCDLKQFEVSAIEKFSLENLKLFVERLVDKQPTEPTAKLETYMDSSTSFSLANIFWAFFLKLGFFSPLPLPEATTETKPKCFDFLLNVDTAATRNFDCTILVEGYEGMPIYVKKSILAMHSEYFRALFFGEFVEATKSTITLKDIDFENFLEYLIEVYTPSPPMTMARVGVVLSMADRFGNEVLLKHCHDFLMHAGQKNAAEKRQTLYLADEFNFEKLFTLTLGELNKELREIDVDKVMQFRPENLRIFLEHCLKQL